MKQIAQYQDGRLELQEVPCPTAPPGGVLVRTTHSVISIGTEKMKVEQARMNLLQKAKARPDQVRKVLDTAKTLGWRSAIEKVRNRLETPTPLGYSAAGVVVEVDPANNRFRIGDRVACSGAECAFHAEYVALPDFLATPIPPGVESWQAAYATVCSIAMQAVRQTEPSLGERVLVMGQGLVGLLVTNLLQANGVRVMAVDVQAGRTLKRWALRELSFRESKIFQTKCGPGQRDTASMRRLFAPPRKAILQSSKLPKRCATAAGWWTWASPRSNCRGKCFMRRRSMCGSRGLMDQGGTISITNGPETITRLDM
jgi:hypothetical protein